MKHDLGTRTHPNRMILAVLLMIGMCAQQAAASSSVCADLFHEAAAETIIGTPQGSQEFQDALRPVYTVDKAKAFMTFDWAKIKTSVENSLKIKNLKSVLVIDGVEQPPLKFGITHSELQFQSAGRQHDVVIQLLDPKLGKVIHETYPIMMESYGSQTVSSQSFSGFSGENAMKLELPDNYKSSRGINDQMVNRTVNIGYKKIVWTLTHSASAGTRALSDEYGLNLIVKPVLNKDGVPVGYKVSSPDGSKTGAVGAHELRIQNDAAFNGNAFLWDNEFVTLASAIHHPYLGQSTLDFHYSTQLENGAIPREVRHSNGISYHRYTDIKFGQTHENDEFTNPNFTGWVERYMYSLSNPAEGVKRFDRAIKSMTAYAKWLDENRSVHDKDGNFIGYWTSNLASGADNAPRGGGNGNKEHFHEVGWVDLLAQQTMLYEDISEMHAVRGEWPQAAAAKAKAAKLQTLLNDKYWDEQRGFYFDLIPTKTGRHVRDVKTSTQASFWPFLAGVASPAQVAKMIRLQMTPERFGGSFPAASLSSAHPEFHREGGYWRGGRWPPSLVVLAQGFENSGRPDEAYLTARNFWSSMSKVSDKTVYEFYGMSKDENGKEQPIVGVQEGHTTRGDFTGWGKTPITYSGLRSVVGFKPIPAFQGQDVDQWIKHLKASADPVLKTFSELTDTEVKRVEISKGYIEWNLFFDYGAGKSVHLENFYYRGKRVRSLTIEQLADDTYKISVESAEPIQIQMNRYFDVSHPATLSSLPLSGSEMVTVGGSQKSVEIHLGLQPKRI